MAAADAESARALPVRRQAGIAPLAQARAHLDCTHGPEKGQTFRVAPGTTTLGRDPACEVVLSEPAVSRQHCRIERRGDDWVLVNLSSNGTRLAKKNIDEAVLADGNEIRIGQKTCLVFVVETVSAALTGRPQFRARTGRPEDREAVEEAPAAPQPTASLFERRKKLFVGLGAYFVILVVVLVAGLFVGGGSPRRREVPILGIEDEIYLADGQRLEITREAPDGIWARDPHGQLQKISPDLLRTGRARRVAGMRHAIEVKFDLPVNRLRAEAFKNGAIDLYDRRQAAPQNLFLAVRKFQLALAHYGDRSYFAEPVVDNIYREAVKELLDKVQRHYTNAVIYETTGDYRKADQTYNPILDMVPDPKNRIARNVEDRREAIQPYLREKE